MGILLRIPFSRPFIALASLGEIVRLLKMDLRDLFLSVGRLPEAPAFGKESNRLRKSLDGDCGYTFSVSKKVQEESGDTRSGWTCL